MTLFRELLNKRDQHYQITLAEPFIAQGDVEHLTRELREFVANELPLGAHRFDLNDRIQRN